MQPALYTDSCHYRSSELRYRWTIGLEAHFSAFLSAVGWEIGTGLASIDGSVCQFIRLAPAPGTNSGHYGIRCYSFPTFQQLWTPCYLI